MAPQLKNSKPESFSSLTIQEIFEQPKIIRDLMEKYITDSEKIKMVELENIIEDVKKFKRIVFLGCGTSYHAGIFGKYFFEELLDVCCEVEFADEFNHRKVYWNEQTLVIALSQSGETADVLKAVRAIKKTKACVIGVTNGAGSSLTKISDAVLYNSAGQEKALAATKTFTSQMMILVFLGLYLGEKWNKTNKSFYKKYIKEIKFLPKSIEKILASHEEIKKIAKKYKDIKDIVTLGSGYCYSLAMESALKFKEMTYVHAEGFATKELKHGPIAMVDKDFLCFLFAPKDEIYSENAGILKDLKKTKSKIILITTQNNKEHLSLVDDFFYTPKTLDIFYPILFIVFLQLFSYNLAVTKDIPVDKPRNLSKFVGR